MSEVDLAIVGGGLVGASLAIALRPTGLRVALVEGVAPDASLQPSFDDRTTALGNGTRRTFEALGLGVDAAWQLAHNGFEASFADPADKRRHRDQVDAWQGERLA